MAYGEYEGTNYICALPETVVDFQDQEGFFGAKCLSCIWVQA